MLRRAIEGNWSEPDRPNDAKTLHRERRERDHQKAIKEEKNNGEMLANKKHRIRRTTELHALWNDLSKSEQKRIQSDAYDNQNGQTLQKLFRASETHCLRECLKQMNREIKSSDSKQLA